MLSSTSGDSFLVTSNQNKLDSPRTLNFPKMKDTEIILQNCLIIQKSLNSIPTEKLDKHYLQKYKVRASIVDYRNLIQLLTIIEFY
jgi:hypothetical protein